MRSRSTLLTAGTAAVALVALGLGAATAVPGLGPVSTRVDPGFTQDRSAELAGLIDPSKPRNVILIIGDGMDDSMITAARNYEVGAGGRFPGLDSLPFTGAMTTYGLKVGAGPDYPIAYVSDSAPTASGWSTGRKTVDSRVSQGPSSALSEPGEDYETVLEQYQEQGKLVGNITSSELSDATPAAAASHINNRACQGPADMTTCAQARKAAGGKGSIAEQLVDHEIDVLMGGGQGRFDQATDAGPTVLSNAVDEHGYHLVQDAAGLDAVTSLDDGPVLGLFAPVNFTPMYQPLVATAAGAGSATTTCNPADRGSQPELSDMMAKSIELLDNPNGFFLQAESAMIDKQEHAADICGAIGDLRELDEMVQVAQAYQAEHPDTLIMVTGDHAHSTQIIAGNADDGVQRATVRTFDGDPMSVAYSTNAVGSDHTGAQIRIAASGPQAANVTGVIDQTDMYLTLLGRAPSTLPTDPASPLRPAAQVAAGRRIARAAFQRAGLPVSVASAGADRVVVRLRSRGRVLDVQQVRPRGGDVRLTGRPVGRVLTVVVRATGAGGVASDRRTVLVKSR